MGCSEWFPNEQAARQHMAIKHVLPTTKVARNWQPPWAKPKGAE